MNLESEKGTLAALLTIKDFAATLPFRLSEADFFEKGHQVLAKVILKLGADGHAVINRDMITSTARDMGLTNFPELTNDGQLIDDILISKPSKEEATLYVKQLKKESLRNIAAENLQKLRVYIKETNDPLAQMISMCEDTILRLTSSADFTENTVIRLGELIEDYVNFLGDNPGADGLDIGFPEWQKCVGGVSNGKVHMFIATFKTGKSSIGQRAALLLSKFIPVLIVDTEMTTQEQMNRLICMLIKMPYEKLREGHWKNPKHEDYKYFDKLQQGIKDFKELKLDFLSATGKNVVDMIPVMRRWVIQNKVSSDGKFPKGLIIYDYLKLNSSEELSKTKMQEYQKLGLDAAALKDFANKYKLPIITFGQTNREDDMTIDCMGASKRLGDLCDSVTLFKEKTPEILAKDPTGSHLFRVFLSRHGPSTKYGHHIRVDFDKSFGHMEEKGMYEPASIPPPTTPFGKPFKKKSAPVTPTNDELMESQFDYDD